MKTLADKKASGTDRKDRDTPTDVSMLALTELPEAPKELSKYEKEFFNDRCSELFKVGILRYSDVMNIIVNSIWWHIYKTSAIEIRKKGYVLSYNSGHEQISPHVSALEKAAKQIQAFGDRYGLSLKSKDAVKMPAPKKKSKLDELM